MPFIDWLIDNALWLMLVANVFNLVIGYWLGTKHANSSQRTDQPNNGLTGKTGASP